MRSRVYIGVWSSEATIVYNECVELGVNRVDVFFVDDAAQKSPSRPGMGSLLGVGGVHVPEESLQGLERQVEAACAEFGFPPNQIFKWSPGRDLWMHQNLIGAQRQQFFIRILSLAMDQGTAGLVIIEDTSYRTATGVESPETDLIQLFVERAHHLLNAKQRNGMVIVSQPSGDRRSEYKFLADCFETLRAGTDYVKPERVMLNVITSPPKFMRLLQLADVVASCTVAFVGGEDFFSPPVFDVIKSMLARELGRIGGVGLKIHPDLKYLNLYHWLLGDTHFVRFMEGFPMPLSDHQYSGDPLVP
jgi:hypothetical protein